MSQHLGASRCCLAIALAASLTTCRFDKLIKPAVADRLAVNPDSLRDSAHSGSSVPRAVLLRIASADGATLPWTATKTFPWVTLSRTSGGAPDSLVVTLHPDTLSQVLHQDTIVFTSALTSDTIRVPVVFDILPPAPELSVFPATARAYSAFAGSQLPHSFTLLIDNTGGLPLTWTAAINTGWLSVSRVSGDAPPQDTTVVTLTPLALVAGTHDATVTVTAAGAIGSPATIPVTFTINPCAEPVSTPDAVVTGSIGLDDCGAPRRAGSQAKLRSVIAGAGDTLSFRLSSLDFDPYLVLTDSFATALRESGDCPTQTGAACILDYAVTTAGRYVIEATTGTPGATGAFALSVVRERTPSAPAAAQFRSDSATAISAGTETPENVVVFRATLNDPNPGDSVRLEIERVRLAGGTQTDASPWVTPGASAAIRVSGLIENEGYHWRARTCDQTGRCSAFVSFGGNPETAADFFVNAVAETPAAPVQLNQLREAGMTSIPEGGTAGNGSATVVLAGLVTDPDPGAIIRLQVEVKATTEAGPDESGLATGLTGVPTNGTATVTLTRSGALLLGTNYYWRARACDQTDRCGDWAPFGGNKNTSGGILDPADTDFRVGP